MKELTNTQKKDFKSLFNRRTRDYKKSDSLDYAEFKAIWQGPNRLFNLLLWHDITHHDQQEIDGDIYRRLDHIDKKIRAILRLINIFSILLGAIITWLIITSPIGK